LISSPAFAQVPEKIVFQRDVQPIFKANCITCHGPSQQKNSFRLDRRRDAMRGGTIAVIGPGNSTGSRLYLRLIGSDFGMQMPPTGALDQNKIEIIKRWIDQGAVWPDEASGELPAPPVDPQSSKIMEALRGGNRAALALALKRYPRAINRPGPGGATPLMYAALYSDAATVQQLLKLGADAKLRNNAGATALMWAVSDLDKTRLLIDAGADVNGRSDDGQTPLLIACSFYGTSPIVKLLLDHGADPSYRVSSATGEMTPLAQAAYAGDAGVIQLLLDRGANVKKAGFFAITFAALSLCQRCVDLLVRQANPADVNMATLFNLPPFNEPRAARLLLDQGADIKTADPEGRTVLMLASASATFPAETVKALITNGADVNARSAKGETALDFARRHGQSPIVDLLLSAGAREGDARKVTIAKPDPAVSMRQALTRSLPLLQRADVSFQQRSGCVSCHNNSLTAMAVATARKNGFAVDEQIARKQLQATTSYLGDWSERLRQSVGIPGDADTISYVLLGLAAAHHRPDATTDAMARFLKSKQTPEGRWLIFAHRPPLESSDFQVTAVSLRALQLYAPQSNRAAYQRSVEEAARWLTEAHPVSTEDLIFQLLGLVWANTPASITQPGHKANHVRETPAPSAAEMISVLQKGTRDLLAQQQADGGWSQLATLGSDAYATGQSLVALREASKALAYDPAAKEVRTRIESAYQRGVQFLLNTQLADGSWYVRSRALPIQPFFESGFPHGRDQFISAAATGWATMALAQIGK
jgi:ankyrin repeat protein